MIKSSKKRGGRMKYYLAVDIGASSGRHILCHIENEKMILEEVYRFKNNVVFKDNHYCWNIEYLFQSILEGIKECVRINKVPITMSIDTWAVDYVLLDEEGNRLTDVYAYRDKKNDQGVAKVIKMISMQELYQRTGIQFQKFNTIYQLKSYEDDVLSKTADYLMIPDYFNYILTGRKVNEYTNMSTTQLLDIQTNQLDKTLLEKLDIPQSIFQKIVMPSYKLGYFTETIKKVVGCDIEVVVPATHDTGSAYMAAIEEDSIILSSGTWSLLGIETKTPYITEKSMKANFTNEGGYDYRYRFLKNIMGLWIIQEVSRDLGNQYSFEKLVEEARKDPFNGIFDVNDERFLKPDSMILEIKKYFEERNQEAPQTVGEIAYCVYNSLAHCYKKAIEELEDITNKNYETINIIGGGCKNTLLNELIAKVTGKRVISGPVEATALGNILSQLLADGVVKDLQEGRQMIKQSFKIEEYKGDSYVS